MYPCVRYANRAGCTNNTFFVVCRLLSIDERFVNSFLFCLQPCLYIIRWVLQKQALMTFNTYLTPVVPKVYQEIQLKSYQRSQLRGTTILMLPVKYLLVQFVSRFFVPLKFNLSIPVIIYTVKCQVLLRWSISGIDIMNLYIFRTFSLVRQLEACLIAITCFTYLA